MDSDKTDFPVYLFSNGSTDIFKDNKPAHFKNRLAKPLNLEGKWEVGLSLISYPNTWKNIKDTTKFKVAYVTFNKESKREQRAEFECTFASGYYDSIEEVAQKLNNTIKENFLIYQSLHDELEIRESLFHQLRIQLLPENDAGRAFTPPSFWFDKENGKYRFWGKDFGSCGVRITSGSDVFRALGFNKSRKHIVLEEMGDYPPSLTMFFPNIFIYSPMVEAVSVGDVSAPLLAVVPIQGKYQHYHPERYDKPVYTNVCQNYISEIELKLTDSLGNLIEFGDSVVGILLHFRRKT